MGRDTKFKLKKVYEAPRVPDKDASRCSNPRCKKPAFTLTHRRHHCRPCGGVFCDDCAPKRKFALMETTRMCAGCYVPMFLRVPSLAERVNSFLDFKSINALLQSAHIVQASFHVQGIPYKVLKERFPSISKLAMIGRGGGGCVFSVEDRTRIPSFSSLSGASCDSKPRFGDSRMRCSPSSSPTGSPSNPFLNRIHSIKMPNQPVEDDLIPDGSPGVPTASGRQSPREGGRCGPQVAVKLISKSTFFTLTMLRKMLHEVETARVLDHPSIARVFEVFQTKSDLVIVMEVGEGGTLKTAFRYLRKQNLDVEVFAAHVMGQCAAALEHMWLEHGLIHRDIKVDNIVVSRDFSRVMLIDFGLTERCRSKEENNPAEYGTIMRKYVPCGTFGFVAPENVEAVVHRRKEYMSSALAMHKADVFSLGVVLFNILGQAKPFRAQGFPDLLSEMRRGARCDGPFWSKVSPEAKRLCEAMLRVNSTLRPTAREVLEDEWVVETAKRMADIERVRIQTIAKEEEEEEDWSFIGVGDSSDALLLDGNGSGTRNTLTPQTPLTPLGGTPPT